LKYLTGFILTVLGTMLIPLFEGLVTLGNPFVLSLGASEYAANPAAPPFWAETWFWALLLTSLYTITIVILYLNLQRKKREIVTKTRFSHHLIESQEEERKRIATALHDGLGQQILVIKNRVELARLQIDDRDALKTNLDEMADSAVISISDIRNIAHGLRPVHLEKFGLTEAINSLCDGFQQSAELDFSYTIDTIDGLIPAGLEINFYRVIQQAISNIQHQTNAKNASVIIKRKQNTISAVIVNDGKEIQFPEVKPQEKMPLRFVLQGMNERIESLGGLLRVESSEGDGTEIKIEIPINV
jgi:signal transduction histidine kinase